MSKTEIKATERLAIELIDVLPDSRTKRRELLLAILNALPLTSEVRAVAARMLVLMDQLDTAQQELVLDFRSTLTQGTAQ